MKLKFPFLSVIIEWSIFLAFVGVILYHTLQLERLGQRLEQIENRLKITEEVFGQAEVIQKRIKQVNSKAHAQEITYMILHLSRKYQIDCWQITAQVEVESAFQVDAIGKLGEKGLLQVRQSTFLEHGNGNINDWRDALEAGVRYIVWLEKHYGESVMSYNAGPNNRRKSIVAKDYRDKVKQKIEKLKGVEI